MIYVVTIIISVLLTIIYQHRVYMSSNVLRNIMVLIPVSIVSFVFMRTPWDILICMVLGWFIGLMYYEIRIMSRV